MQADAQDEEHKKQVETTKVKTEAQTKPAEVQNQLAKRQAELEEEQP